MTGRPCQKMMENVPADRVRNIGIVAHIDAGKTTTSERFLFYAGRSHKMGEVHDGQAILDFRVDERDRGITISAAATTLHWRDHRINLIDTPGHVDFTAEVERALRVLDGAVVVFDGVAGVEPQSETVWHQADRYHVPRIAFVNKLDRVGADFDATLQSMIDRLGANPIAVQFPDTSAEDLLGIVDLIEQAYLTFDRTSLGREVLRAPIPDGLRDEARRRRSALIEAVAEVHDGIAEAWIAERAIEPVELRAALRQVCVARRAVPVLCGAALRNAGVQPVLDAVCDYLPSPLESAGIEGIDPRDDSRITRRASTQDPFAALVFKLVSSDSADLFYLRVYSGALDSGERALNPRTRERERLRRILRMHADRGESVQRIEAGDIVAVEGLHRTVTGDTLCDETAPILLERIQFPDAVVSVAVEPRTSADRDRLAEVLKRVQREDPTVRCTVDAETGQTLLSGMGELHLEVVLGRMQRDFGVEVRFGRPRVSYRETVRAKAEGAAEYRRPVAGENLFARVEVSVEPLPEAGAAVEIVDELTPTALPAVFRPAIVDSLRNTAGGGGLYGYPVTGVRVRILAARYDDAGQPEIALNSAASLAFRHALTSAGAAVVEPYGRLTVRVPEENLGAVVKSLHQRRAVVEDTGFGGGAVIVRGVVPIAEMFGYLTVLRSQTQGRGSFSLEPLDYRRLPDHLTSLHHPKLYE